MMSGACQPKRFSNYYAATNLLWRINQEYVIVGTNREEVDLENHEYQGEGGISLNNWIRRFALPFGLIFGGLFCRRILILKKAESCFGVS